MQRFGSGDELAWAWAEGLRGEAADPLHAPAGCETVVGLGYVGASIRNGFQAEVTDTFSRRQMLSLFRAASIVPANAAIPRGGLERWLWTQAQTTNTVVIERSTLPLSIDGPVRVPPGITLVVQRDLLGVPQGGSALELSGTTTICFDSVRSRDVSLRVVDGAIKIVGFTYSGYANIAAILIDGPGPYKDLRIEDLIVVDANYGVLRDGRMSTMKGGVITRARFSRLRGDAIEWNVSPYDADILVNEIDIDTIGDPQRRPAWGIGIGFAGRAYDPDWRRDQLVKRFRIVNVRGCGVRQLIHVEAGADFSIENIVGRDISPRYVSDSAGIETAFIACYGCSDFSIRNVASSGGSILLYAGVTRGRYSVPSTNFEIDGAKISRGDIAAMVGGTKSYAKLHNVRLSAGGVRFYGAVRELSLSDVDVTTAAVADEPFLIVPEFLSGPLARFRPPVSNIRRNGVRLERVNR